MKACSRCGKKGPLDSTFFATDNRRPDGLSTVCRKCTRETANKAQKKYYQKHKIEVKKRVADWRRRNPDKVAEYDKKRKPQKKRGKGIKPPGRSKTIVDDRVISKAQALLADGMTLFNVAKECGYSHQILKREFFDRGLEFKRIVQPRKETIDDKKKRAAYFKRYYEKNKDKINARRAKQRKNK